MSNKKETFILPDNPILANKLNRLSKAIEDVREPFIVHLVLSGFDGTTVSGTMDKTVGEIFEAYKSSKRIMFSIGMEGVGRVEADLSNVGYADGTEYPSFNVVNIDDGALIPSTYSLVYIITSITNNPESNTWTGRVLPLTQSNN